MVLQATVNDLAGVLFGQEAFDVGVVDLVGDLLAELRKLCCGFTSAGGCGEADENSAPADQEGGDESCSHSLESPVMIPTKRMPVSAAEPYKAMSWNMVKVAMG